MYEQYGQGDPLFMTLYGAAAMLSLTACCYLLFRRANAIAPDVSSSIRLRRWTAAFFACMTLSHIWYLPLAFLTSTEDVLLSYLVGAILDFMTLIPLAIVIMFVMLQVFSKAMGSNLQIKVLRLVHAPSFTMQMIRTHISCINPIRVISLRAILCGTS